MAVPIRSEASERLGCLEDIDVFFTDVCTGPRLCAAPTVTSIEFNRVLDEVSRAIVELAVSDPECCECYQILEPWCHMMHIVRNGELVWQGPLTRVSYGAEVVRFEAEDILAFMKITVPAIPFSNSASTGGKGEEITDLALKLLKVAFADRAATEAEGGPDQGCLLENIIQADLVFTKAEDENGQPVSPRPSQFFDILINPNTAGFGILESSYFDWWQSLAENGLDYTVVGTTIILAPEEMLIRPLRTLSDEHIMGEVFMVKDGFSMANRAYVRYEGDDNPELCAANCNAAQKPPVAGAGPPCQNRICNNTDPVTLQPIVQPCYTLPCPAIAEIPDSEILCYGRVERVFTDQTYANLQSAQRIADLYVKEGAKAPIFLDFSGGARLSPDTPWGFNDMIPGGKILVAITENCLGQLQEMRILEVSYRLSAGEEEEISLSLGPYSNFVGIT